LVDLTKTIESIGTIINRWHHPIFTESIPLNFRVKNLLSFLKARHRLRTLTMKFQCISCGRVVSAQLPHLHKNRDMGYCENFSKKNFKNFSDGPLID